jgi:hypothetical protein
VLQVQVTPRQDLLQIVQVLIAQVQLITEAQAPEVPEVLQEVTVHHLQPDLKVTALLSGAAVTLAPARLLVQEVAHLTHLAAAAVVVTQAVVHPEAVQEDHPAVQGPVQEEGRNKLFFRINNRNIKT